jgi:hypothetical protein
MSKKTSMSPKAASRIQAHSDRSGNNQGFKARAQGAAAKNAGKAAPVPSKGKK